MSQEQPALDVEATLSRAIAVVESRYHVTIDESAKDVLRTWVRRHPEPIERALAEGWDQDRFIEAAKTVLEAASVWTLTPQFGEKRYENQPDELIHRDRLTVGQTATVTVLRESCPFYGMPC